MIFFIIVILVEFRDILVNDKQKVFLWRFYDVVLICKNWWKLKMEIEYFVLGLDFISDIFKNFFLFV